jgi:DNA-binding CsgD family transcriptional regulator
MSDPRLSARELQVLRCTARHHGSAKLVGAELGLATQTVYEHRRNAYAKLGAHNLTDALERLGWLRVPR